MARTDELENGPDSRERILGRLDAMVAAGRVTEAEAARLRAATVGAAFDEAVAIIRARHAGVHLKAAVDAGQMTGDEATTFLERLAQGEHPRSLRSHLRKLRQRAG